MSLKLPPHHHLNPFSLFPPPQISKYWTFINTSQGVRSRCNQIEYGWKKFVIKSQRCIRGPTELGSWRRWVDETSRTSGTSFDQLGRPRGSAILIPPGELFCLFPLLLLPSRADTAHWPRFIFLAFGTRSWSGCRMLEILCCLQGFPQEQ